jgi:hypothetical protein
MINFRRNNYNESLGDLVKRKHSTENILYKNEKLYRQFEPIFKEPLFSNGRAQFYTPEKRIGQWTIDSYIFNTLVIWISIGILYITLYFDVIKKGLSYFSKKVR